VRRGGMGRRWEEVEVEGCGDVGETGELGRDRERKGKCVKEESRQGGREFISMQQPRTGPVEAMRPDQSHFNGNVGRASSHASAWK